MYYVVELATGKERMYCIESDKKMFIQVIEEDGEEKSCWWRL